MAQYSLHGIREGAAGTRDTLKMMDKIIKRYKTAPAVRKLALAIVANLPAKDWAAEARAIQLWVQNNIRYVKDVFGVETLQSPIETLKVRQGDCDDQTMLTAALLNALGHPTRCVAVGPRKGYYQHVFCETKIGRDYVAAETIEPWPLGRLPKNMPHRLEHHN